MSLIFSLIITFTRCVIQHPKPFILIPILTVFLLSYNTFYKLTLFHSTYWLQLLLHLNPEGPPYEPVPFPAVKFQGLNYNITKITFSAKNALSFETLRNLSIFEQNLSSNTLLISPLSFILQHWRSTLASESLNLSDKTSIDKKLLKLFNYRVPGSIFNIYFANWHKLNLIITSARLFSVYLMTADPEKCFEQSAFPLDKATKIITADSADALRFLKYYSYLLEANTPVKMTNLLLRTAMFGALFFFCLYLYVTICNCHKIRSSIGLLISWTISILLAYLAALNNRKEAIYSLLEYSILGAARWQMNGVCILCVMLLSSRTFYRILHDLAGDYTFGESESLHKRVIKFYLGFNISEKNSLGVFWVSQTMKNWLFLNKQKDYPLPLPNITCILLINLAGFTTIYYFYGYALSFFLQDNTAELYWMFLYDFYVVVAITLLIDHLLQLTFIATIIIVDLNKVELTDMLKRNKIEEGSPSHEVNPISDKLLRWGGENTPKGSKRHRLGTYLLQVSQCSLQNFWLYSIPVLCFAMNTLLFMCVKLTFPHSVPKEMIRDLFDSKNYPSSEENTLIYYLELAFIMVIAIGVCELCFSKSSSKFEKDEILELGIPGDKQAMLFRQLSELDASKRFECITLGDPSSTDILKLYSNSKCSHLLSVDLDQRYIFWEPKKGTSSSLAVEIVPSFEITGEGSKVVNHVEISDGGDYVIFMNFQACRIKCYESQTRKFTWEVSLTSELVAPVKRMKIVTAFFRKRTVVGFLARKLLLRKRNNLRRGSEVSMGSNYSWSGNYLPPSIGEGHYSGSSLSNEQNSENLHREEFITILETGEMIVIMCNDFNILLFNLIEEAFQGQDTSGLTITSLKFLASARVSDKVVCNISNNDLIVGTAIKNTWRFHRLELTKVFKSHALAPFAPPLMSRGSASTHGIGNFSVSDNQHGKQFASLDSNLRMNKSTIVTIEFVGMFVRVKELTAEMVDILTGTILRVFHIGSFKPGTFRVAHSEPTHCKFCGCASVESLTLLYEDLYEKTLILHTFKLQNAKSRNNICLRVERDPREVRCMGLDSVIESHYWYTDVEQWEVTDMNVIIGIRKETEHVEDIPRSVFDREEEGILRRRKRGEAMKDTFSEHNVDCWQGFVVTALNGKLLEYKIPGDQVAPSIVTRPNYIVKYGYKAVAVVLGSLVKILYLGNDKLIENDLYYSGTTSSLNPILQPGQAGKTQLSNLLFINKRRGNRFNMSRGAAR